MNFIRCQIVNKRQKCLLYINAEQSAREEAPVTPPLRLNTARRPNAGVAEELRFWCGVYSKL